jgi:hypothetical protein
VLMVNFDSVAARDRVYAPSSVGEAWPQLTLRSTARQTGITISWIKHRLPGRMQAQLEAEAEALSAFLSMYSR